MEGRAAAHEEAFVASLASNRAGRTLADHLASVEACARVDGLQGSVSEAIGNEKVFMHALCASIYGTRPYPCGLPTPLGCRRARRAPRCACAWARRTPSLGRSKPDLYEYILTQSTSTNGR